jgi:acetyltransferase-like isoleucine patch superfamily enzyme
VKVGSLAWLGIGSCVIQGRSIGARATVGAGSVVIRDVEEGVTVVGNPARRLRDE